MSPDHRHADLTTCEPSEPSNVRDHQLGSVDSSKEARLVNTHRSSEKTSRDHKELDKIQHTFTLTVPNQLNIQGSFLNLRRAL